MFWYNHCFSIFVYLELGNITFPELPQETILEVNLNYLFYKLFSKIL